jgi:hypothetical protein
LQCNQRLVMGKEICLRMAWGRIEWTRKSHA